MGLALRPHPWEAALPSSGTRWRWRCALNSTRGNQVKNAFREITVSCDFLVGTQR
jgi:hypothetical protein